MRGELCIGSASILSLAALLILIFVHVGQTNTSSVPRRIAMAKLNVSLYGEGLTVGLGDTINGLYTTNASAPLQEGAGLRQLYEFGLYSYCAYTADANGTCTNHTIARGYKPYDAITSDMIANYSQLTNFIIQGTTFKNSNTLASHSASANYCLLVGTICVGVALLTFVLNWDLRHVVNNLFDASVLSFASGIIKHTVAFFISAFAAFAGTMLVLTGSALWTSVISRSEDINSIIIGEPTAVPLGIIVSSGTGVYLSYNSHRYSKLALSDVVRITAPAVTVARFSIIHTANWVGSVAFMLTHDLTTTRKMDSNI
ncbi:hypothetical protein EW146_g471 [Bondarzewia mesenterica]|uniref:Uncharacterized protein n=1 Tax=Bondarzewia mesenterica TaxID=1095465 RepID=A0A4S4M7B0_9AGAM|nr:hypothetical protein EW146_g471 [Bondarzewia mesenterica]